LADELCGAKDGDALSEQHFSTSDICAVFMEHGPQTLDALYDHLYPGGKTSGRKDRKGEPVPKRKGPLRDRVQKLINTDVLTGALPDPQDQRAQVLRLHPRLGWVAGLYVGTTRIYTGIYAIHGDPLSLGHKPWAGEIRHETDLRKVLKAGLTELAARMTNLPSGPWRGLALGLPAAIDSKGERVSSRDPRKWSRLEHLPTDVADLWGEMRARFPHLPVLPTDPLGRLALTIDTDIVMDTLAAMYVPPTAADPHNHTSIASVVLGIKCSGGVRSTVISRGSSLCARETGHRRPPGTRRDQPYRGAYGDTTGLGHTVALVHRARAESEEDGWEDVHEYWRRINKPESSCACGEVGVPHLERFISVGTVLDRLGMNAQSDGLRAAWREVSQRGGDPRTPEAGRVLSEVGRLLGYAVDMTVRLFDPQAVVVTGMVAMNP
jgi:hypothetical protein